MEPEGRHVVRVAVATIGPDLFGHRLNYDDCNEGGRACETSDGKRRPEPDARGQGGHESRAHPCFAPRTAWRRRDPDPMAQLAASFETIQPNLKRRPRLARISRRGSPRRSRASTAMKIVTDLERSGDQAATAEQWITRGGRAVRGVAGAEPARPAVATSSSMAASSPCMRGPSSPRNRRPSTSSSSPVAPLSPSGTARSRVLTPLKTPQARPRRPAASSGSSLPYSATVYLSPSTRISTARGAPPLAPGHHQESSSLLPGEGMTFSCCS
jgi:hypothetical protein